MTEKKDVKIDVLNMNKEQLKQIKESNIYQKMSVLRKYLVLKNPKKTGELKAKDKNGKQYVRNNYYELGDFMPIIIPFMEEIGLFSHFGRRKRKDDGKVEAIITYTNCDKTDEELVFAMDYHNLSSKYITGLQAVGGTQTFLRRYLYMISLELTENDTIEKIDILRKTYAELKEAGATEEELSNVKSMASSLKADKKETAKIDGVKVLETRPTLPVNNSPQKQNMGIGELTKQVSEMSKIGGVSELEVFYNNNKDKFQSALADRFEKTFNRKKEMLVKAIQDEEVPA